jgi:hypothetical protein
MTSGIPRWARLVMSIDEGVRMLSRAVSIVRDEMLLAFVAPEDRQAVTTAIYDRQTGYVTGGDVFSLGLFEWERRLIATAPFPQPPARLLLGGAGGGREIVSLRKMGYEVWAFEPSTELVRGGQSAIAGENGAKLIEGDYSDLVRLAHGSPGRLESFASQRFDAVIVGWGSLSYVFPHKSRLELLNAIHTLAPDAPVMLSFIPNVRSSDERGKNAALRRLLRRVLPRRGGQGMIEEGEVFMPLGGFAWALSGDEVRTLAQSSGYRPIVVETKPYGHALLSPN